MDEPYHIFQYLAVSPLIFLLYFIGKGLYNLFLHPLRHIPGPKIAAWSSLYEFYYDVLQDGQYLWKIEEMHNRYGKLEYHLCQSCTLTIL